MIIIMRDGHSRFMSTGEAPYSCLSDAAVAAAAADSTVPAEYM